MAWTTDDVVSNLLPKRMQPLTAPMYLRREGPRMALAVSSMRNHMTDEGWQIMDGLGNSGYLVTGYKCPVDRVDVNGMIRDYKPSVMVVQDKREWDFRVGDFRDPLAKFRYIEVLRDCPAVFTLTILKDSHQRPDYHIGSANEMGCHAWVIYYHPKIVKHLAPYIREEHCIRVYHSLDPSLVPPYSAEDRDGTLVSGALSRVYPLRKMIVQNHSELLNVDWARHPGYHRNGSNTPDFLKKLSRYKVSICTSSIYGYALRKLFESTACGCRVLTDLPEDETLPYIDGNLTRVNPSISFSEIRNVINEMRDSYDPEKQAYFAELAKKHYDFRESGKRLAADIETLRTSYQPQGVAS